MPNYTGHLILNFMALSTLYILYVQHPFLTTIQLSLFIIGFFIGTVLLTPDIDLKSEPARRCGIACTPYRKIFSHRGFSHHWFWGTITRVIYVLIIIGLLAGLVFILKLPLPLPDTTVVLTHPFEILMVVAGLFLANVLHTVVDAIF